MKFIPTKTLFAAFMVFTLIFQALMSPSVTGALKDKTAPTAPTSLKVSAVTTSSVSLIWTKSYDKVGVMSYNIYRDGVYVAKVYSNSYTGIGLVSGRTYKYYVKALDGAGNVSAASNTVSVTIPSASTSKVVGYYAAWAAYSGFTPDKLDASKLTHINYSFANIGSDLKISMGYPDVDPANFTKLKALKTTYPNLKTLISVGGWSWSGRFSDASLTEASRTAFADSCVNFIVQYGFDGIDIDWEYPVAGGLSTNIRRPEDKQNYTLLMQKLREKLDARTAIDGKKYILTMAGAAGGWYLNNVEMGLVQQYIDYANIMTYDIHGPWDSYTDFNAPLYNNSDVSPQDKWSVDASVNVWLKTGIPASKLVVGVPFYGYKYNAVNNANNGLYQTYSGSASIAYSSIATNYLNAPGYVRYFHQQSMVPWLYNGSTFITYEDAESMGHKAQYIKNKALGGAAIWELSQDPNEVLLGALYNGLN